MSLGLWYVVRVMKFVQMLSGGSRLLKAIAHKELASVLNDDALSLHSEMLIVKVMQFPFRTLPNVIMAKMPAALLPCGFVLTALRDVRAHLSLHMTSSYRQCIMLMRQSCSGALCWPLMPLARAGERELLLAALRNLAAECC